MEEEFEAYLKCGRLEVGFLRLRCEHCHAETLVGSRGTSLCRTLRAAFGRANRQSCRFVSCKTHGFCPSRGARRMAETAALLADEVLPERPLRQWVLSLPFALRFLLATAPKALTLVLGVVYRTILHHLLTGVGLTRAADQTCAVTLGQCFGSALNLNLHFHMIFLDGVYLRDGADSPVFRHVAEPGAADLQALVERIATRIGHLLEKRGLVERDSENVWLAADAPLQCRRRGDRCFILPIRRDPSSETPRHACKA